MAKTASNIITDNRKARHDYQIEQRFEAGIVLEGWEIKSIRAGHVQIAEGYVVIKKGEAWLLGANITPLITVSTHKKVSPDRTRKLLLHEKELSKLIGATQRQGYTIIPLNLHWKGGLAKLEIALAKGKKLYDKRADLKKRDWERQKQRLRKTIKNER